jgi:hypothetical protein
VVGEVESMQLAKAKGGEVRDVYWAFNRTGEMEIEYEEGEATLTATRTEEELSSTHVTGTSSQSPFLDYCYNVYCRYLWPGWSGTETVTWADGTSHTSEFQDATVLVYDYLGYYDPWDQVCLGAVGCVYALIESVP